MDVVDNTLNRNWVSRDKDVLSFLSGLLNSYVGAIFLQDLDMLLGHLDSLRIGNNSLCFILFIDL